MSFTPKTTLEKILCGVTATAKNRLEKAFAAAMLRLSNDPVTFAGTTSEEDKKIVITMDCTAEEMYAAINAEKMVKTVISAGGTAVGEAVFPVCTVKKTENDHNCYRFGTINEYGKAFSSGDLTGNAAVVLTEV